MLLKVLAHLKSLAQYRLINDGGFLITPDPCTEISPAQPSAGKTFADCILSYLQSAQLWLMLQFPQILHIVMEKRIKTEAFIQVQS